MWYDQVMPTSTTLTTSSLSVNTSHKFSVNKSARGFTLIELLVAISIIAILSIVGLVSFQGIRGKVLEARRRADIDAIKKAYEIKYDPGAFGGQGGYQPIKPADFVSGKIPVPDNPDVPSYITVGNYVTDPVVPPPSPTANFAIAYNIKTNKACSPTSGTTEEGCIIKTSNQGPPVDPALVTGGPAGPFTNLYNDSESFWRADSGNWSGDAAEALIPDSRRKSILVTNNVPSPVHSGSGSVKLAVSPASGCCSSITGRHDYPTDWSAYKWLTFWWYGKNTGATVDFHIQTGDINPWDSSFICSFKDDVLDSWKKLQFKILDPNQCQKNDLGTDLANLNKVKRIFIATFVMTIPTTATSFDWYLDDVQLSP